MNFRTLEANISLIVDEYGSSIMELIQSPHVERLKHISFLGTLANVYDCEESTRYEHSIAASAMAIYLSHHLNLNQIEQDALVLYYLFHDIGHMPFSHVYELYIYQVHTGHISKDLVFHDALTRELVIRDRKIKNYIYKNIKNPDEVWNQLDKLLKNIPEKYPPPSISIVNNLLSIDRIEGITRTATALKLEIPPISALLDGYYIDRDGYVEYKKNCVDIALSFWDVQADIYKNYVYSLINQSAETMLKSALQIYIRAERPSQERLIEMMLLGDNKMLELMNSCPESYEILKLLAGRTYLSPLWFASETYTWSNDAKELGSKLTKEYDRFAQLLESAVKNKVASINSGTKLFVQCTRFKEFFKTDDYKKDLFWRGLARVLSMKKTTSNIPLAIFTGLPVTKDQMPQSPSTLDSLMEIEPIIRDIK